MPIIAESAAANRFRVLSRVANGTNQSLTTIATAAHFRPEAVLAAGNLLWMSPDALKYGKMPDEGADSEPAMHMQEQEIPLPRREEIRLM